MAPSFERHSECRRPERLVGTRELWHIGLRAVAHDIRADVKDRAVVLHDDGQGGDDYEHHCE
jgi:hypothetical protein